MRRIYLLALLLLTTLGQAQITLEANINPDNPPNDITGSSPASFIDYQGNLLFKANQDAVGIELFEFTVANGVNLIADVFPGTDNGSPDNFTILNGTLYFTADDVNVGGIDLFSYDGTSVSSESLYGNQFSGLFNPSKLNGKIYYTGFNSNFTPNRLIEFDGTNGGEATDQGSGEENVLGGKTIGYNGELLLYMRYSTDEDTTGTELYKYDPISEQFSLVKDINPGSGNSSISDFYEFDGLVYFEANNILWSTDGTNAGTSDIAAFDNLNLEAPTHFADWNGELYFEAETQNDGDELFKYDPTNDTVTQLSNIDGTNEDHDPKNFVAIDGYLYYAGEDGNDNNSHLWRTDGTTIEQIDNVFTDVENLFIYDDRIFFSAEEEDVAGEELYSFDPDTFSIATANALQQVTFYPNPSDGLIQFDNGDGLKNYRLYDISGKQISQGKIENSRIDLNNIATGNYLLLVDDGKAKKTFRLVLK